MMPSCPAARRSFSTSPDAAPRSEVVVDDVQPVAALDHGLDQIGHADRLTDTGDRDLDGVRVRHGTGKRALQLLPRYGAAACVRERGEDVEADPRQRDVATVEHDPRT